MWQEERQRRIRSLLVTFGQVSVDDLTADFGVSRETIRRDLMEMEEAGELRRVRGGGVPVVRHTEAPYLERAASHRREKQSIARAAATLVESGQTLFLDCGTTTAILAERLAQLSGLTVITNSFDVAKGISSAAGTTQRGNRVVILGGAFADNPPATLGATTINEIGRYQADFAMVSPFGLDADTGATSYDPDEAEVARAMLARARKKVILADYSKLGVVSRVAFCAPAEADHIIVDARARQQPSFVQLRSKAANVIVA